MNQWQYDTIIATLQTGAPALAPVLCEAFANMVKEYQELKKAAEAADASTDAVEKEDN